jgi:NitT/TauT family transport system ATP-binding protein
MMLEVREVFHWFGTKKVLQDISFRIAAGQIVSVVGPSGCGKSTLLRAILGTHPPRRGEIVAAGQRITHPNRHVGIVYQNYSLYDFLTARENIAMGLMLDQTNLAYRVFRHLRWRKLRAKHLRQADEMLASVYLDTAAELYPREMSGGMRQRVAIAQALIMRPRILLLDEPFGALDEATREELQLMLLRLYQENQVAKNNGKTPPYTILIVTHELNEALYVADRILGLSQYHAKGEDGATIVYDKAAPIFHPDDPRDFEKFTVQKEDIRQTVFDAENIEQHNEFVTFWQDHPQPK